MSYRLPASAAHAVRPSSSSAASSSGSSASDDQDRAECDNFDNFDELDQAQEAFSLFDQQKAFPSVAEAIRYDDREHGWDLEAEVARLALDFHQRVRLINHIRKETPSVDDLRSLTGSEAFLSSDELLIPVLPNDAYLQVVDDAWSDSEDEAAPSAPKPNAAAAGSVQTDSSAELTQATRRIRHLEEKIAALEASAKAELDLMRKTLAARLNLATEADKPKEVVVKKERDDDTHYFDSYAYNDIHEIMLKDTTRTKSYALFILSNPELFKGATVLDVGCGTGILSLLCARAGASHVYAVDASDVAVKAIENIKRNGCADSITVVRGKVEDIQLPEGVKVDVIVSEWMGYILYESMLDSVLVARDRFLKPTGVMAPSQTKIMLVGVDCAEFMHDRVGFWKDVYGFDFEAMAEEITEDSLVEIMNESELVTDDCCIKDILISTSTIKSLDFHSSFKLRPTKDGKMHAFLAYFDTFFTPSGAPAEGSVSLERFDETLKIDGRPGAKNDVSFTTGPKGVPTHWKQTVFILKEPIEVTTDSTIEGTFSLKKSKTNSRELDVEIHWQVLRDGASASDKPEVRVQVFKVR